MESKSIEMKLREAQEKFKENEKLYKQYKEKSDFWIRRVELYEEKLRHQKQGQLEIGGVE
ncbi:MAG: hypothetical protein CL674_14345 [Bdellovibrionaceae bacterium]|nr:hypothetical protein [Pseudobdellovibrionaceae bacterium]MAF92447.1 hypothetical protein [Pseudobdellovibrionaceae bacterium]QDP47590.1 MAG: hypothetical protein GOVbin1174_38 [Prokaryotic dsDNA virus sp.]